MEAVNKAREYIRDYMRSYRIEKADKVKEIRDRFCAKRSGLTLEEFRLLREEGLIKRGRPPKNDLNDNTPVIKRYSPSNTKDETNNGERTHAETTTHEPTNTPL